MADMSDVLNVLTSIENYLSDLPTKILLKADQIYIVNGLSDVSENLGIVTAGEFRAGNRLDPGKLFTGMRMAYPALTYSLGATPTEFHLVGVNADVLQFGVNATNGTLVAGAGAVVLSATGIAATAGSIAGWTINSDHLLSPNTPGIEINSTGSIETTNFVSGITGVGWKISEAGDAEFNNAIIRGELRTTVLTYQETQAVAGTMGVFKSAGVLLTTTGTVPAVAGTLVINIKDPEYGHTALFAEGDILRIKDATRDTWLSVAVGGVSDKTTYYEYTCTVESGTTGGTYTAGQAVVDYGASGQGYLLMEATGTGAPYFSVRTHAGAPYTTASEHVRMGNLNDWDGGAEYSSDIYGVAIGQYAATYPNITIDPTNGLRMRVHNVTYIQLEVSGSALITNVLKMSGNDAALAIGATPPTGSTSGTGLWLSKAGLFALDTGAYQVKIDTTNGKFYAGAGNVVIDADGITLTALTTVPGIPGSSSSEVRWTGGSALSARYNPTTGISDLYIKNYNSGGTLSGVVISAQTSSGYSSIGIGSVASSLNGLWYPWHVWTTNNTTPTYTSASSITFSSVDVTSFFPVGTRIRFTQTTAKYFIVEASSFSTNTVLTLNGGGTYTVVNAAITDLRYSHAAVSYGMPFGSSTFIPLTTPLTSTSYDGGDTVSVGTTSIDTSSVFSAPAGIKGVMIQISGVWSSANNGYTASLRPKDGSTNVMVIRAQIANINSDMTGFCPCDSNGDLDLVVAGADMSNTVLRIHGYFI